MQAHIIQRLNDINRQFYATTAADFDATRGQAWPGWEGVTQAVPTPPRRVLDVGCGNGRFGVFLSEKFTPPPHLHGMDNNTDLLRYAATALESAGILATLEQRDVVQHPPDDGLYDWVVAFGLLHHIPGAANRRAFVKTLAERVAPGGVLAFACWRFYEFERFQKRIVAWPPDLAPHVEQNDYLLDWRRGETAIRYCHHVDDAEQSALEAATGFTLLTRFRADGFTATVNAYSVLRRP